MTQAPPVFRSCLTAAAILFCGSAMSVADVVIVENGDRLTGEVVRQDAGQLELKTDYAGTLKIEWGRVREVVLDAPAPVLLDDKTVVEVNSVVRAGDELTLRAVPPAEPVSVPASSVRVIEPEPWELGEGGRFKGRVNIALKFEDGNTDKKESDFDFDLSYRTLRHDFAVFGDLEYDRRSGITSSDNWTLVNSYNRLFESPWYGAGFLLFKHDRFADLKLRTLLGPSAGYRFFDSKARHLKAEVGIQYLNDDFYDQAAESFWGPGWYLDYDQQVWRKRLQVYHRQFGFFAANDSSKYLWRGWFGIRMPVHAGLYSSVEYEIDYDSEPAIDAESTDTTLRLKLGYKW